MATSGKIDPPMEPADPPARHTRRPLAPDSQTVRYAPSFKVSVLLRYVLVVSPSGT